jgi:glycosyltransferase involved in cell wall biosynthesis
MNIVHVCTNTSDSNIRGDQRHVLWLVEEQQARGLSVTVITDGPGAFTDACRRQNMPVIMSRIPDVAAQGFKAKTGPDSPLEKATREMAFQLRNLHADLVHCHDVSAGYTAIVAGNRVQIPCVLTLHLTPSQFFHRLRSETQFTLISVSKSLFDNLRKVGVPNGQLHYVPNGTKTSQDTNTAADTKTAPERRTPDLIMVGRLVMNKGVDTAILAVAELRRRYGGDCPGLNLYGEGQLKGYYQDMVKVLELENIVRFHGIQLDILGRCPPSDMLVVASRSETGPLVVLEAMSRGMPIVTSTVGDVAEMLPDHRYGRIVPTNSIIGLADAIDSTLSDIRDGRFDPALLIERHREFYTCGMMAERIESIYNRVLEKELSAT